VKRRIVADRFFKELEPNEIRAALTGELAIKQLNMGIVPLRDVGRYGDFAYLFKNLLRLNDLNQKDVKDTLLTVYRHGIRNAIEVDLNKEYTDAYSALMVEKAKLANIRQVALIANHLKAEQNKRIRDSRDLPALYAAVVGAKARQRTDLLAGVERDRERLAALEKAAVDAKVYGQYPKLSEEVVKSLVVDDKWLTAIAAAIHGEMDRISQALTRRVKELAERYETPLPQQANKVLELERKVAAHLAKMGFSYE